MNDPIPELDAERPRRGIIESSVLALEGGTMKDQSDAEFTSMLRSHLAQFKGGHTPVVPLIKNADGTINREKTLALPCYQNFKEFAGSGK